MAERPLFVVFAGVSGCGKSLIMHELRNQFPDEYSMVRPYTTRQGREGETDKIPVTENEFFGLVRRGSIFLPVHKYDAWYGGNRLDLVEILSDDKVPLLDWGIDRVPLLKKEFSDLDVRCVYVHPGDPAVLTERLSRDGRDQQGGRLAQGLAEISHLNKNRLANMDHLVVNYGPVGQLVADIHGTISSYSRRCEARTP